MTATPPPLPIETLHDGQNLYFTAPQMLAYGAACAAAAVLAEREAIATDLVARAACIAAGKRPNVVDRHVAGLFEDLAAELRARKDEA